MSMRFKCLGAFLSFAIVISSFIYGGYVKADSGSAIPIKTAVIYDASNINTNQSSDLFNNVVRVLKANKMSFDSLDISAGKHINLLDNSGNVIYAVAAILADGSALDATNSQNIVQAVSAGMGAIATLPTTANAVLSGIFGIATLGNQSLNSAFFTILKDKFTFSYANTSIYQPSNFENCMLLTGADVVASFPINNNEPAIWTYNYGAGKTVYHNTTATNTTCYWGLMLQSLLYAMPIGVACPDNVMALNVDDCPTSYYTPSTLQGSYYDFMTNYLKWLSDYNVKSTFYVAFSYSGDVASFWDKQQSLQAAADIVRTGNELGLHCGDNHLPLDPLYWGSTTGVDSEVNTTNQAIQVLTNGLSSQFGINLGKIVSYVAPGNCVTDYGYQTLKNNTTIKYVGEGFGVNSQSGSTINPDSLKAQTAQTVSSSANDALNKYNKSGNNTNEEKLISQQVEAQGKSQSQPLIRSAIVAADSNQYTLTINCIGSGTVTQNPVQTSYAAGTKVQLSASAAAGWQFVSWNGSTDLDSSTANPATITMNNNETITALFTYPQTFKDFGFEGNTGLYNLPRIEGGIPIFGQPQNPVYPYEFENLLTSFESGQPYIAFTHPDEAALVGGNETEADVFNALSTWANYIVTHYPYYRWMTSSQIGDYLSSRTGTLSAQWVSNTNTLQITLAQLDDPVHIKSTKYLQNISLSGNTLTLNFGDTSNNFQSSQFDVIRVADDYFIYPLGQKALMPVEPSSPFVFQSVTQPDAPPVLNGIGNQQSLTGQLLSFSINGIDPNNDTLSYSASNLPAGASFDSSTHTFSWTPTTAGVYSGIRFSVSDGILNDYKDITITVVNTMPSSSEINNVIGTGPDDGFSASWGYYNNDTWAELGNPSSPENAWFRFTGINIPKGATIVHAYLQTAQAGWISGTSLKISGEKVGAPIPPANALDQISRVRTIAGVNWTSGYSDSNYHNSPDIAAVIQELVNSYDYSAGGIIQLLVDNNGSPSGDQCLIKTFESGSAPKLDIVYQLSAPAPNNAAEITAYSLPGQTGSASINSAAGTIGITMPSGTNVSALIATFTASAGVSSVKVGGVSQVSGATANNFTNPVTYVVTAQDGTTIKNWTVTVTVAASNAAQITAYSLPGQTGSASINSTAGTIGVTMPSGTNVSALIATFTASAGVSSVKVGGVSQVSGATANNFTNPVTYVVTAQDGTTIKNWTVTVTVQSATTEIIKTVSVGADDGFSGSWGYYNNLTWAQIGNPGAAYNAWFRFTGINIPKGATIVHAYLQTAQAGWISGTSLKISGEKAASPSAPTSAANQANRLRTIAGVNWTSGYSDLAYHNSPDIAAVIQELVNSYDYSAGGIIQLLVDNNGSPSGDQCLIKTFESGSAPKLDIVYQLSAPAPNNAAEITAYSLPGQTGSASINSAAGTIGITMPSGTNVSALIATFTASAGVSSVKVGGVSQVSGATANNFTNPVTYVVTAQDGTTIKNWTVTVTVAASNAAQITAYSLPGQTGSASINSTAGTIGVTMPSGTNVSALIATFTASAGVSSVKVGGVSQVSGATANNFTNPVTYVVTAQDGTTIKNWTVTVTVQSATTEIIKTVSVGADDGFSGSWGYYNNLTWAQIGNPGAAYNAWFRFTGINIPKGATIVHAYLQTAQAGWISGTSLKISGEKAASPSAPTSAANQANRVRTIAGVNWTSGYSDSNYHNSPDIAAVIQELVNSYDYSAGGIIQLLVDNNGSPSGDQCLIKTFESGSAPKLDIVYQY